MGGILVKSLQTPDETRPFQGKGQVQLVRLGESSCGLATLEPGWRWSTNVKPIARTSTCEKRHLGYCLSGRLRVRMDDGEEQEIKAGDSFVVEPGHDAWVVGAESCVTVDFEGSSDYARAQREVERAAREQPQPWMQ